MIKYIPATIRYFIKFYRTVRPFWCISYISEALSLFSLYFYVFPAPCHSSLPSFPCFLQQTNKQTSNPNHSSSSLLLSSYYNYYSKKHNKRNQKIKKRNSDRTSSFSPDRSASHTPVSPPQIAPTPHLLSHPSPPRPPHGSCQDAAAARAACRPAGSLARRRVDPRPAPRTNLDSPLPSTPTQRRPTGPVGPLPLEVAEERIAIPGRPGGPGMDRGPCRGS